MVWWCGVRFLSWCEYTFIHNSAPQSVIPNRDTPKEHAPARRCRKTENHKTYHKISRADAHTLVHALRNTHLRFKKCNGVLRKRHNLLRLSERFLRISTQICRSHRHRCGNHRFPRIVCHTSEVPAGQWSACHSVYMVVRARPLVLLPEYLFYRGFVLLPPSNSFVLSSTWSYP